MALYHVHADVISKGKAVGGSAGFARYITREEGHAVKHAQYVGRESHPGKDDCIEKGQGGPFPTWARDGIHFFQMSDRYSHKNAVQCRVYEIALPREMDSLQRAALAADLRATFFERYPHVYAIHNPIDSKGLEHPHMHLMLSEKRMTDMIERGPKQFFAYAAAVGRDPATGGVRRDRSWQGPSRLRELRFGIATLTNAALEREGYSTAVSDESLRTRGYTREACIYRTAQEKAQVEAQRKVLHEQFHPGENDMNVRTWEAQKRHEGIRDLSRQAMIDHVRDRFFQHDHSPAREQERVESLERTIDRAYARTGRVRAAALEREAPARPPLQRTPPAWGWGHEADDVAPGGVHVRLERGMEVER